MWVPAMGAFPSQLDQVLHRPLAAGSQFPGIFVTQLIELKGTAIGDLGGPREGIW
ncbi:MAG: hypothetical protein GTO62_05670 [Planctomycetales bacterium]|nr:hypothetical protein [Planctomycetales bacterium]